MAATEHRGLSGGDYNVDLLPIDQDDSPPSSWRLSLDTFRLPSSSPLSSGRHNGRTRLSRYLRTPSKFLFLVLVLNLRSSVSSSVCVLSMYCYVFT